MKLFWCCGTVDTPEPENTLVLCAAAAPTGFSQSPKTLLHFFFFLEKIILKSHNGYDVSVCNSGFRRVVAVLGLLLQPPLQIKVILR